MNLEALGIIVTSFLAVLGWGEKRMADLRQQVKEEMIFRTQQLEDDKKDLKEHIIRLENKVDTLINLQLQGKNNDRSDNSSH